MSVAACLLLGACVDHILISKSSPPPAALAPEIAKAEAASKTFPTFASIPPAPTNVRPAKAYGVAAADVDRARDKLIRETGPETWTLNESEAFAGSIRDETDRVAVPSSSEAAATEAFARKMRERATPPPLPR